MKLPISQAIQIEQLRIQKAELAIKQEQAKNTLYHKGDGGAVGPQGERGLPGERGLQGDPGPIGPAGDIGPVGPQGERGLTGEQGKRGPRGSLGLTGERGPVGAVGPQGQGFRWRGEWKAGTQYEPLDVVSYQGSSWVTDIATKAEPGRADWKLFAQKGADGAPGARGATVIGPPSFTNVGATPDPRGVTTDGVNLTLQIASSAYPGLMSAADKSKLDGLAASGVSLGTANGLSLAGDVLSLAAADGTHAGALTSGTQTIGGNKTLTGSLTLTPPASTTALQVTAPATGTQAMAQFTDSSSNNFLQVYNPRNSAGFLGASIDWEPLITGTSNAFGAYMAPTFAPASNNGGVTCGTKFDAFFGKTDGTSTIAFNGSLNIGVDLQAERYTSGNMNTLYGVYGGVYNFNPSGTISTMEALHFELQNAGNGTNGAAVTFASLLHLGVTSNPGTGVITTLKQIAIDTPVTSATSGSIVNNYALYIASQKVTGITNAWGLYQVGATTTNYMEGKLSSQVASGSLALTLLQGARLGFDDSTGAKYLSSNGTALTLTGLNLAAPNLSGTNTGDTPVQVLDEGVSLTAAAASINFVGAGVTATNTGSAVTVTIAATGFLGTANTLPYFDTTTTVASTGLTWDNAHTRLGVNNVSPSEALDVTGNIRFSGAIMPNNTAGTTGQVLTSAGAGAVPTWTTLASGGTLTGSSGKVAYWDGATSLNNSGNFLWNNGSSILTVTGQIVGSTNVQTPILADTGAATRIGITAAAGSTYKDAIASPGAGSIAHLFDTSAAYSTAGGLLVKISNNGTQKASVDLNGRFVSAQASGSAAFSGALGARLDLGASAAAGMLWMDTSSSWRTDSDFRANNVGSSSNLFIGKSSLTNVYQTNKADGSTAVAHQMQTVGAYTTAGSKLFSIANLTTEKTAWDFNGKRIYPATGAADVVGVATLAAGTVTVSTTAVKTGDQIRVSVNTPGGTLGIPSAPVASIVDATSFVINSSSGADTSTINWEILHRN